MKAPLIDLSHTAAEAAAWVLRPTGLLGSSLCPDRCVDELRRPNRVLVRPEAEHSPPIGFQCSGDARVARLVGCDLLVPVRAVGRRAGSVKGAPVPEATIDVDGNPASGKHDVWSDQASSLRSDREVDAISKPKAVESSSQSQLRTSVASPIRAHDRSTLLRDTLPC